MALSSSVLGATAASGRAKDQDKEVSMDQACQGIDLLGGTYAMQIGVLLWPAKLLQVIQGLLLK